MKLKIFCFLPAVLFLFFALGAKAQAPAAISNLQCVYSGSAGSVWLTWTPPADATSYQVAYALSPLNENNFNLATQFLQSWPASANKEIVNNLSQNQTWFFAMKSQNASGTSAISNIASCLVPKVSKIVTTPVSVITSLQTGATLEAGQTYIIKGQATDSGGSSINNVEISFDGGNTWFLTTPLAHIDTGFTWQYVWASTTAGVYNIKTKASDWLGAVESPGAGISVTVSEQTGGNSTSTATGQQTVSELQAQINQLQLQIVQILQQLIGIVSQKISGSV